MARTPLNEADKQAALNLQRIWEKKRNALDLTQEEVALTCGWNGQSAFNQYLKGRVRLNVLATLKIANALNCKPEEIRPDFAELLAASQEHKKMSEDARRVANAMESVPANIRRQVADAILAMVNIHIPRPPMPH